MYINSPGIKLPIRIYNIIQEDQYLVAWLSSILCSLFLVMLAQFASEWQLPWEPSYSVMTILHALSVTTTISLNNLYYHPLTCDDSNYYIA